MYKAITLLTVIAVSSADFLPNGCPSDPLVELLLPHETYCTKYYSCSNGEKIEMNCTSGLYFNPDLQECDYSELVNCTQGPTTTPEEPITVTEGTTTPSTTTQAPVLLPNGCPEDPTIDLLLPHESDCGKFYSCVHGQKVEMKCISGLWFDFELQQCDYPNLVNCTPGSTTTSTSTTTPEEPITVTEGPTTTTQAPVLLPNGCPEDPTIDLLLPHESDCGKFYSCVHGQKVEMSCISGLWFDFESQQCDFANLVNCTPGSTTTTPEEPITVTQESTTTPKEPITVTEETTTTTTTTTPEEPITVTEGPTTTTQAPVLLPNGCPEDPTIDLLLPHESDCGKFYSCVHGQKVEMKCLSGLWFDIESQKCDYPELVNCTPGPTTTSTSTTTPEEPITVTEGTTTTTQAPVLLPNGCPEDPTIDLLLPHESDCGKFYSCVHGQKVEMKCLSGLWFDFESQKCDYPELVNCTPGPTTTSTSTTTPEEPITVTEGPTTTTQAPVLLPNGCPEDPTIDLLLPHESDCGKFYSCVHGQKVEMKCLSGLWFDFESQQCDYPELVNCTPGPTTTSTSTTTPEEPITVTEGTTTTTQAPVLLPNGCPEDPTIDLLLPHESDCGKFYSCVHGQKVEMKCLSGLWFDFDSQKCDYPELVNCTPGPTTTSTSTTTPEEPITVTEGSTTTTEAPVLLPNGCPEDPTIDLLLPHESDCGKFYSCVHGQKVEMKCLSGLWFDFESQQCDYPELVNCTPGPTTTSTSTTTPEEPITVTEGTTTTTQAPVLLPNGCPEDPTIDLLLPHESDCGKFYSCVHGQKVEMKCLSGLWFDFESQQCDYPELVNCTPGPTTTSTSTTTPEEPITVTEGPTTTTQAPVLLPNGCPEDPTIDLLLPHESDCGKFYSCVHGQKVEMKCLSGLWFDFDSQQCDYPELVNCTPGPTTTSTSTTTPEEPITVTEGTTTTTQAPVLLPNGCPEDPTIDLLLPHESDCGKFYSCVHGQKVEMKCLSGLWFDFESQQCDYPELVNCTPGPTTTSTSTTTPEEPITVTEGTTTTTQAPVLLPNGCPEDPTIDLLLPHESDCGKFYSCVHGQKVEMKCISGLWFDFESQQCDYPELVNCTPGPTTTSTSTTTPEEPITVTEGTTTTTQAPVLLPNGCPEDPTIDLLLPHESDCGKFYSCVHGQKVEMKCISGLWFDFESQQCDYPELVNCTPGPTTTSTSTTTPEEPITITEGSTTPSTTTEAPVLLPNGCPANFSIDYFLPHDWDCSKFYSCVHGQRVEMNCAAGTWFSFELQRCDYPNLVNCIPGQPPTTTSPEGPITVTEGSTTSSTTSEAPVLLPNGCPADHTIHLLLPHESDCGKFYSCFHGQKIEMPCPTGLWFDVQLQLCSWPFMVDCIPGTTQEPTITTTSEEPCDTSPTGPTEEPITVTEEPITATEDSTITTTEGPEFLPNGCPSDFKVDLLLPHESDCAKFYSCAHGEIVEMECADGTWFDFELQWCSWPFMVQCNV